GQGANLRRGRARRLLREALRGAAGRPPAGGHAHLVRERARPRPQLALRRRATRGIIDAMILACPSCDARYDVSGYAVGQQLRCRCGTVMTRPAEKMQAGLLACPQCGAGVSPTSSTCEYCSASLLLKQCPRCLSRVFHGHKHCPECGVEIDLAAVGTEQKDLPCPRCTTPLTARKVGDIVIDECGKCLGLFLD